MKEEGRGELLTEERLKEARRVEFMVVAVMGEQRIGDSGAGGKVRCCGGRAGATVSTFSALEIHSASSNASRTTWLRNSSWSYSVLVSIS